MTNFEKKKGECLNLLAVTMALVNGKPVLCDDTNCYNCDFYEIESGCDEQAMEWLLAEYQEPAPKLTKRERYLLESFTHSENKSVHRIETTNELVVTASSAYFVAIKDCLFPFIKRGETWTFEDLPKLEVEE